MRNEWVLPNPTTYVEFDKAMAAALAYAKDNGIIVYDDTIKITATDTEIIIYILGELLDA